MHKWMEGPDAQQPRERTGATATHTSKASVLLAGIGVKCLPGRTAGPAPEEEFDRMMAAALRRKADRKRGQAPVCKA